MMKGCLVFCIGPLRGMVSTKLGHNNATMGGCTIVLLYLTFFFFFSFFSVKMRLCKIQFVIHSRRHRNSITAEGFRHRCETCNTFRCAHQAFVKHQVLCSSF